MIRFADVTPDAKPKKAVPPPAAPKREPAAPALEAETEAAAPKPGKAPRKKKSG